MKTPKIFGIPSISSLKFPVLLLLLQSFLLVTAPFFIKAQSVRDYQFLVMVYMLMTVGMRVYAGNVLFTGQGIGTNLMWFGIGLFATSLILTGGSGLIDVLQTFQLSRGAPVWIAITQGAVIAASEETIFRGLLPKVLGVIGAQVAFGVFHLAAYGLNLTGIGMAIIAGFVFYFAAKYTNSLGTAIGMHMAYNIWALGVI
jgi:membrane protease YdiL (CAAX protease family)